MSEWVYFIHPPRDDFIDTITDEATAHAIMESDPAISSGQMTGELRGMRVSLLRGRD